MNTTVEETTEITEEGIRILFREMGVAKALRFLREVSGGYGNYTEERRELFKDMSLDDIVAEIKKMREKENKF